MQDHSERDKIMIKFIGKDTFKEIDKTWHKLSQDGFMWVECGSTDSWLASGWISK